MRTILQNVWRSSFNTIAVALVCIFVLVCAIVVPTKAYAAEVGDLTINQAFTTKGSVPSSVTGEFSYELSSLQGAPLPSASDPYTFALTGDGASKVLPIAVGSSTSSDALVFTQAGVYEYNLRCATVSNGALLADASTYHVSITVVDNGLAAPGLSLQSIVVKNNGTSDKSDTVTFKHSYEGSTLAVVVHNPVIKKSISGTAPSKDSMFRFNLVAEDKTYPMPEGSVEGSQILYIEGDGQTAIDEMVFTQPGEYVYTVTEFNDGAAYYTYDKSVYRIIITVTENPDKTLQASRKITKDGEEIQGTDSNVLAFTNHYDGEPMNPVERVVKAMMPVTGDSTLMLVVVSIVLSLSAILAITASVVIRRRRNN